MKGAVQSQRRARMETEFLLGADMTSPFRPGFCNKVVFLLYCNSQSVSWLAGWSLWISFSHSCHRCQYMIRLWDAKHFLNTTTPSPHMDLSFSKPLKRCTFQKEQQVKTEKIGTTVAGWRSGGSDSQTTGGQFLLLANHQRRNKSLST